MNKYIDHTLLKANAKKEDIIKLCDEAKQYKFKSVCINPYFVSLAKKKLKDSNVLVCTVIGFPLGANLTKTKILEAKQAIEDGADELDVVINISKFLDKGYYYIEEELKEIVKVAKDKLVKVIIETAYLTDEEITKACAIVNASKARFIKTSTGFAHQGATIDNIKLMKKATSIDVFIKASGGIKTYEDAKKMIEAGADRIGTSNGVEIMKGAKNNDTNSTY